MEKTILENQVVIMKSLIELIRYSELTIELREQIMITEARIRAMS